MNTKPRLRWLPFLCAALALGSAPPARAQDAAKKAFDLPADDASVTLKQFSEQSGVQIIFPGSVVKGVTTNAVKGDFTPEEAIDRMLAGTPLYAVRDESSGSFAVNRRPSVKNADSPPPGQGPAAGAVAAGGLGEGAVQLNPFEVTADPDNSYAAVNSNSITQFNTALDHLPVSADIFDQAFMKDVGENTLEDLIQTYSAGAGYSGIGTNGGYAATNVPGDRVGNAYTQLRGLPTPAMQLDSLLTIGTFGNAGSTSIGQTNLFNIERVEVINGPQAMLYDGGGGGGVINAVSKQARFGSPAFGSFEYQVNEYGGKYGQFDYGASDGNFAIRIATVNASNSSRRVDIGDELNGQYIQLGAKVANTTFRLSLEQTVDWRVDSSYQTVNAAGDPTFDQYSGESLGYLLATGAAGQGTAFMDGHLNWNNVNSWEGDWASDEVIGEYVTLVADSQWTSWLSSQVSVGFDNFHDDHFMDGQTILLTGLNGNAKTGVAFTENAESDGIQLALTANPVKEWRLRLSAAWTNGTYGNTVGYGQRYNDQFYENAAGDVTYADGSVVYVPATFNSKALTVTSATAGAVPLTITLLSTPGGQYFANPLAITGAINSDSNAYKVLAGGTEPGNTSVGMLTGQTGLPITDYQLNTGLTGIVPTGVIDVATAGNDTTGYPGYSVNLTSVYEFDSGCAKGVKLGGTVIGGWQNRRYYYSPTGYVPGVPQALYSLPTLSRFDLIAGYSHKFGRIDWSIQLNVYNIFNHYDVVLFPDGLNGWTKTTGINANFSQQPRSYLLTNTISF